jgi:hypothetical protein
VGLLGLGMQMTTSWAYRGDSASSLFAGDEVNMSIA